MKFLKKNSIIISDKYIYRAMCEKLKNPKKKYRIYLWLSIFLTKSYDNFVILIGFPDSLKKLIGKE